MTFLRELISNAPLRIVSFIVHTSKAFFQDSKQINRKLNDYPSCRNGEIEILKLTDSVKSMFTIRNRIRFHVITPNLTSSLLALTTYHNVAQVHVFGFK